jgi:hypothetical protein
MRKDIKAINEAFSKVIKENYAEMEEMENTPSEDAENVTPGLDAKHDKAFYTFWEDIADRMSDDVLESTMYMIKNFDALNKLIKEEHAYRSQSFEA